MFGWFYWWLFWCCIVVDGNFDLFDFVCFFIVWSDDLGGKVMVYFVLGGVCSGKLSYVELFVK